MSEIQEHVAYLSQEIGPRPAGTEEEQQAALYVAETLQKDAQLPTSIEDFNCNPHHDITKAIWCGLTALFVLLSLVVPEATVPAFVVTLLTAVLFALESFGKSPFSRMFLTGASQNVVAKYEPSSSDERQSVRRRKIILVANYDSGKVRRDLAAPTLRALPIVRWVELGAMIAAPILLLVEFLAPASDVLGMVFAVLLGIVLVIALLPVVSFVLQRVAPYNEGANCNASGVAVLLEVAVRIGRGRVSEDELEVARVHGEEEARALGLVPEGAEIVYETTPVPDPSFVDESPESRLLAAKAAVAALSGVPVSSGVNIDISSKLVQAKEPPAIISTEEERRRQRAETLDAFAPVIVMDSADSVYGDAASEQPATGDHSQSIDSEMPAAEEAPSAGGFSPVIDGAVAASAAPIVEGVSERKPSIPAWFKSAREKARRSDDETAQVQRSRYADALDSALHNEEDLEAVERDSAAERLQKTRESVIASVTSGFEAVQAFDTSSASVPTVGFLAGESTRSHPGETVPMEPVPSDSIEVVDSDRLPQPMKSAAQAAAERTISFIPVPIDEDELASAQDAALGSAKKGTSLGELDVPSIEVPADTDAQPARRKRVIDLPSLTGSLEPLSEAHKQRAPLAEGGSSREEALNNLRATVPSIASAEEGPASRKAAQNALRSSLPSLSGVIRAQDDAALGDGRDIEVSNVSQVGSFTAPAATGAFAPVGEELLSDVALEDMYVEDADDSDYDDKFTETGAYAGPGYVDMPKSRASRFLDKFKFGKSKKKAQEETTPQQWLDVEDDFEAREVGRQRGGWESFRDEDNMQATTAFTPLASAEAYDDYDEYADDYYYDGYDDGRTSDTNASGGSRSWNGGGFNRAGLDEELTAGGDDWSRPHRATGERTVIDPSQGFDEPEYAKAPEDQHAETMERIYGFRHPDIDTEVWFVALGSELAGNAGMSAFLDQHASELKGAIVVELDGLGAGDLSVIEREGTLKAAKASSRMKRLTRKAAGALGISVATSTMLWKDGPAAYAARHGVQMMHIAGLSDGKPAYYGEAQDTYDKVDEDKMLMNADFIMELLKNI